MLHCTLLDFLNKFQIKKVKSIKINKTTLIISALHGGINHSYKSSTKRNNKGYVVAFLRD